MIGIMQVGAYAITISIFIHTTPPPHTHTRYVQTFVNAWLNVWLFSLYRIESAAEGKNGNRQQTNDFKWEREREKNWPRSLS